MLRSLFNGVSKTIEYPLYCAEVAIQGLSTVGGLLWGAKEGAMIAGLGLGLSMSAALATAAVTGLTCAYVFNRLTKPEPFSWEAAPETATDTQTATDTAIAPKVEATAEADARPVRDKFADAGSGKQTTRAPKPSWATRAVKAANDKVRNAWGEGPMAMPVPA
ncbi:MAG: hypothetical protein KGQ41_03925 [Alphaproteobacteria bacterium]|nr:hypothetical protein [Alphaproteobacteria bacterium]